MSRLPSLCCCILLFVLINSSQSNNPFSQFGVFCKTKMENQLVNKTGCDSRYVQVNACIGTCASYTHPLDHPPYFKKFCKCCKPLVKRWKMFNLPNCTSGISPLVQVEAAVNCNCTACSWNKRTGKNIGSPRQKHLTGLLLEMRQNDVTWQLYCSNVTQSLYHTSNGILCKVIF